MNGVNREIAIVTGAARGIGKATSLRFEKKESPSLKPTFSLIREIRSSRKSAIGIQRQAYDS